MAHFWLFNMGYSAKTGDRQPQTLYRFKSSAAMTHNAWEFDPKTNVPLHLEMWEQAACSDPWGFDSGSTPDWLVGRYGNWWGAQWSGARMCGFDGVGPTDCPFIDPLDEVALSHDIECWLVGEMHHNPKLAIASGDAFRVENVYQSGGKVAPHVYYVKDDTYPHTHAFMRLKTLSPGLRKRLKMSVVLYTILQTEQIQAGGAAKIMRYRYDSMLKVSLMLLGLAHIRVTVADLIRALKDPRSENLSLTLSQCGELITAIQAAWRGGGDPRTREILEMLER